MSITIAVLAVLILLLSVLGIMTGVVLLIIQAVGKKKLKGAIVLPVSIGLFIISLVVILNTDIENNPAPKALKSTYNAGLILQKDEKKSNQNFITEAYNGDKKKTSLTSEDQNTATKALENETSPHGEKATVARIVDGDTIEVNYNGVTEDVRLLLVDTPETVHPNLPVQTFGPEASQFAKDILSNQQIQLEFDGPRRDKYDRLLAYIWINGKNFNQLLLEKGLARYAYIYDPPYTHQDSMKTAENNARAKGIGIWSIDGYVTAEGFQFTQSEAAAEPKTSEKSSDPSLKYDPKGKDRDCGDFDTHKEAQAFFEAAGSGDPHRLDGTDNDGLACENLP